MQPAYQISFGLCRFLSLVQSFARKTMPPFKPHPANRCVRDLVGIALLALVNLVPIAQAQALRTAPPPDRAPVSRIHYGDNPAWADPRLDDSSWSLAPNGEWPGPPTGGFVWVRVHLPWPASVTPPLGLRETRFEFAPAAEEIYLDGALTGKNGALPPHAELWTAPPHLVWPIPEGSQQSSSQAVIAVRAWINPRVLGVDRYTSSFTIADLPTQQALAREARYSLLLRQSPFAIIGVLLVLVGTGLLAFGIAGRRREVILFAVVLIAGPLQAVLYRLTDTRSVALPLPVFAPAMTFLLLIVPISYVEFLWQALRLGGRRWKLVIQGFSVLTALTFLVMELTSRLALSSTFDAISTGTGALRDLLEAAAAIWAMVNRRPGRWLAFAVLLTPAASFVAFLGDYFGPPRWSVLGDAFFEDVAVFGGVVVAAIVIVRARNAWRTGQRLSGELEAARDLQQRLVPTHLPLVPGWNLSSAYLPASEVGGDFYQVIPLPSEATLIVVGDVSGKGLKAAMTGTLVMGALRSLAQEDLSPAHILTRLNAMLTAAPDGGFVTCLCARIEPDSNFTVANAGHLTPYCNGEELKLESSLPLGIDPDAVYFETTFRFSPNDRLTLLSDGVIEAKNPQGELFGFDRTAAISTHAAEAIAQTAQAFGQEDDIMVLTLSFAPSAAIHG